MEPDRASAYSAHHQFVAPARAHPEIWRLLVGLGIVGLVATGLNSSLLAALATLGPASLMQDLTEASSPLAMLVLLSSFASVTLGVGLAAKIMQHRPFRSVIGKPGLAFAQFRRVLGTLMILGAVIAALPPYDMGKPLIPNLSFAVWLSILPMSLLAVLIQTSAEEVLFRGYLQQSLAARFRSPWIWMVLPSALFAAGHYSPAEAGENALLVALWSGVFSLFAADLTARSGTLGPAIALHFFNNVVALLFVALPGTLSGLALFLLPYEMSDTGELRNWLFVDIAVMFVGWLAARLALRR